MDRKIDTNARVEVPIFIIAAKIPAMSMRLWVALSAFAKTDDDPVVATKDYFATMLGCGKSTIARHLKILEEKKLIVFTGLKMDSIKLYKMKMTEHQTHPVVDEEEKKVQMAMNLNLQLFMQAKALLTHKTNAITTPPAAPQRDEHSVQTPHVPKENQQSGPQAQQSPPQPYQEQPSRNRVREEPIPAQTPYRAPDHDLQEYLRRQKTLGAAGV